MFDLIVRMVFISAYEITWQYNSCNFIHGFKTTVCFTIVIVIDCIIIPGNKGSLRLESKKTLYNFTTLQSISMLFLVYR